MTDAAAAVERYVAACNAQDWAVLEEVFAPDLHFEHVSKGFTFDTSAELIATLKVLEGFGKKGDSSAVGQVVGGEP